MKGKKLKGDFALVHMKKDEKTWLLIKHRDKYAVEGYNSEDHAKKSSLAYTAERNSKKAAVKKSEGPAEHPAWNSTTCRHTLCARQQKVQQVYTPHAGEAV
jgi:bifunctional non-homologous end joining protein LigD